MLKSNKLNDKFQNLPIYDDPSKEEIIHLAPYKVINKDDFMACFDDVLNYMDKNEVILEIRGNDKNDTCIMMKYRLYRRFKEKVESAKEMLHGGDI